MKSSCVGVWVAFCCLLLTSLAPARAQLSLHASLEEEQPAGTPVVDVIRDAQLADRFTSQQLQELHFTIIEGLDSALRVEVTEFFQFRPNSSSLQTARTIDRDELCVFRDICEFNLEVGLLSPSAGFESFPLTVAILDINDNSPVFPEAVVTRSVPETAPVGFAFEVPAAEDADAGVLSVQTYELLSHQELFRLNVIISDDVTTLTLSLRTQLDREVADSYDVSIVARDGGSPAKSGSATIQIRILDSNDNYPKSERTQYDVTIA